MVPTPADFRVSTLGSSDTGSDSRPSPQCSSARTGQRVASTTTIDTTDILDYNCPKQKKKNAKAESRAPLVIDTTGLEHIFYYNPFDSLTKEERKKIIKAAKSRAPLVIDTTGLEHIFYCHLPKQQKKQKKQKKKDAEAESSSRRTEQTDSHSDPGNIHLSMPLPPSKPPIAEGSTSALARPSKNKKTISGNVSQSSIFDLKGLVSEHQSTFQKEGREAVKGEAGARRGRIGELSKDRFSRPSPNLGKRLAQQAENDAKRARIYDDQERITEHERQEIMRLKAERYEKLRKGEEAPSKESAIDFDRKQEEEEGYDHWSDHASDVDESALVPDQLKHFPPQPECHENDNEEVEYVDEMGRTRKGTRREARKAEAAKASGGARGNEREVRRGEDQVAGQGGGEGVGVAHAEVLQSNVIYGEQSFFPVYEPTQEELKARYKVAEGGPMVDHYDAKKEVRTKGAGFYQFAQDEEVRRRQMEELRQQRDETEQARAGSNSRGGTGEPAGPVLSAAQEAKKRKLDERRALIEAKRQKMLGGKEAVEQKKKEIQDRAVDALLRSVEQEMEEEKT